MKTNIELIHDLELQALTELKTFCDNNNIKFYLRGGSVMGAVKYNGFVPWDDDADIAVPRDQYNKLIKISQNTEWSKKFYISSYKYDKDMHCYFPRVLVKEKVLNDLKLPHNNKKGLTIIDILPLDGAPNFILFRLFYYLRIFYYRALAGVWTLDIKETVDMHDKKKRFILKALKFIGIKKLYKQFDIYEKLDKIYSKNDYKKKKYTGTITGSLYSKEIFKREIWGEGIPMKFGDAEFLVPDQYDFYLKKLYGNDYLTRTPSDVEKSNKNHIK